MKKQKKDKFISRIVPGTSRTPDTREFFIPQISKLEDKETKKQKFVSPIFGKSVKDEVKVPNDHSSRGDIDKKYDVFRKEKKLTKEEAKKRYGDSYYEFFSVTNKDLSKIHQHDLSADDLLKKKMMEEEIVEPVEIKKPTNEALEVPMDDFFKAVEKKEVKEESYVDKVLRDLELSDDGELEKDRFAPIEDEEELDDDILFASPKLTTNPVEKEPSFDSDFDYVETPPVKETKKSSIDTAVLEKLKKQVTDDFNNYAYPPVSIFKKSKREEGSDDSWIQENIDVINQTMLSFDVDGQVVTYTKGPTVTRYEVSLGSGVQIKKLTNIADNIQMNLAALS
ncbi:MAG: DNA translocase FtsK, partial [Candidatus Izemoplasmatales bacterium]